jgi:hypothetical protein
VSRGGFDIDDFRDSDWEPKTERELYPRESFGFDRETSTGRGGSPGGAQSKRRLAELREAEFNSDRLASRGPVQQEVNHPTRPGDPPQIPTNPGHERAEYQERDRTYLLRPSEIHTLTEVGKFRLVAAEDIAKHGYAGDCSRMKSDLRSLMQQRLIERRETSVFKNESRQVLTLTKRGQRLIRRQSFVREDQAIYSGLVKPKEAEHDSDLYRLYHKAAREIESKGGKVLRVQLDYELKENLYRKLGEAQAKGERETQRLKEAFARQMQLPVVHGKVSLPDLRIEYANQEMEISRVDLELATGHYHAGHLAEKARAGFQIYARSEDAAGLRRIRDDREIMTSILSL